jgi:hypothetical protein
MANASTTQGTPMVLDRSVCAGSDGIAALIECSCDRLRFSLFLVGADSTSRATGTTPVCRTPR